MIQLDRLTKRFPDGTVAVDELSLTVPTGEVLALLGTSGSGKTTTLRMINRLVEPTSGTIVIDGRDIRGLDVHELRRGIGYVIQQAGLFPHRTVVDNVTTVPRLLGWDRKRARDRAMELLDLVGLGATFAKRYPAQLSGGQQQRVGVARALAADPPVLLMDEPFGAVDPIVRGQLQEEFLRLQRELHKTVVFVTHDVDEAIAVGSQVALLRTGGVLAQLGTPGEVLAEPADEFVADFMGADRQVKLLGLLPATAVRQRPLVEAPDGWELLVDADGRPTGWQRLGDAVPTGVLAPVAPGADARAVLEAALASANGAAVHVDETGRPTGVSTLADLTRVSLELVLTADRPPYWNGPQLAGNWDVIRYYTLEHIRFTVIAVVLGMLFAFPIAYLSHRRPFVYPPVLVATNVVYAIPSLALFALLGPFLGYTNDKPIILAMALYTLVILVRNIVEGLRAVPAHVTDAATGMGFGRFRRFTSVELPLAMPTIIAGLRLATVSTISLITVGGAIGKGALGRLFTDGISRLIVVELWAGVIAVVVLALVADVLILTVGRLLTPWTRAVSR